MTLIANIGDGSTLTADIGYLYDEVYLQQLIDLKVTIPAGDYIIKNSIKVNASGTYNFDSGVTITCHDDFVDSDERNFTGKDRAAAFWVYEDNVDMMFNNTIINCNQDVILAQNIYMNCIIVFEHDSCYVEKIIGHNTHNTVLGRVVTNFECNDSEISHNENVILLDDNFVNATLDIQSSTRVIGSGFIGIGCEEVVDVNSGCSNVVFDTIYGEDTTEVVLEIGDSTDITADNITGGTGLNDDRLVAIYRNTDTTLTNMQDNIDWANPGYEASKLFYIA